MANSSLAATLFSAILFLALPTTTALAHPGGGMAVSTGSNPVRSVAGLMNLGTTSDAGGVITAPGDQDLVLTDIIMGIPVQHSNARASGIVTLTGSDGVIYAIYSMRAGQPDNDNTAGQSKQFAGPTGVRIPAGVSLSIHWDWRYYAYYQNYYELTYVFTGYLAQP